MGYGEKIGYVCKSPLQCATHLLESSQKGCFVGQVSICSLQSVLQHF
jgi:hypothetical protein